MNDAEKLILEQKLRKAAPLINRLSLSSGGLPDRVKAALNKVLDEKFPEVHELTEKQMESLVLKLIAEQPADGFELINNLTKARFQIKGAGEGVIYGILAALESGGLVEGRWRESSSKMVKTYHVTEAGTRKLRGQSATVTETQTWANLVLGRSV
jgi:DNA-binding PadR family transcriptional regulator